jgi:hypothetical protein
MRVPFDPINAADGVQVRCCRKAARNDPSGQDDETTCFGGVDVEPTQSFELGATHPSP